jgi:hypothetical protein
MIKCKNILKRENLCTSYRGLPTEHPQAMLDMDLLRNPTQHRHSRRPSASGFATSQRRYRHI